ncbi:hypothetical protein Ga0074812_120123 [Parafrankia irregularis]|uniref:AMIN-like domain-containing protein n=1 Tax=Parafrankia irregularis TaxID=795642 RepID=A0A0S4QU52_9ACTN|nr:MULTISPECIES: hypothetical protein [Parafrankia]MBE3204909.1 hypothetical protein [Parafrankia sp. CH37]CUU58622.1 hypothetical protein Ga0074812_120123 [Parafrankia irregularis]
MERSVVRRRAWPIHRPRTTGAATLSILLCAGVVACGDGSGPRGGSVPVASASASADPGASASASASASADPGAGVGAVVSSPPSSWGTGAVSTQRQLATTARLVALRGAHNTVGGVGFDRLVLEFRGGLPGYTAGYVDEVVQPGSGAPLPLEGAVTFEVVVTPAAAHDDAGVTTLTTPRTGGGLPVLTSYVLAGDFEGYVHVGTGLSTRAGFRVLELTNPDRLVIDFAG